MWAFQGGCRGSNVRAQTLVCRSLGEASVEPGTSAFHKPPAELERKARGFCDSRLLMVRLGRPLLTDVAVKPVVR